MTMNAQNLDREYTSGQPQRVGMKMADFALANLSGDSVRFSDYSGKTVMLNAWATWCPPCRSEIPALNQLYHDQEDNGLVILGINAGESASQVVDFKKTIPIDYPVLLDPQESLMDQLAIHDYPTTILVGPDGVIRYVHIGLLTEDTIKDEILPLLQ